MARLTTWQSSLWARWLGWTLVFGLVAGACGLAYRALRPEIAPAWSLALLVPLLVAAFLIGVRFPFWRWAAGPPVAMFLVGTPLLLIPYAVVVPLVPGSMFQDMSYALTITIAGFLLFFLATITLVLCALAATAGVWWGQRREVTSTGSTESSLGGDAST
jgi:hypothetical protein